MNELSVIMAAASINSEGLTVEITEDWTQGRTIYGGMQAAVVVKAMAAPCPADTFLRSVQMTFIGPMLPGLVHVATKIIRQGKSTTHVQAIVMQNDQLCLSAIGIFARNRISELNLFPTMPPAKTVSECHVVPSGYMPAFAKNLEIRPVDGSLPLTKSNKTTGKLYCRHLEDVPLSLEHVVALADIPPPMAASQLSKPAPGSSMNWHLDLITPVEQLTSPWVRIDVDAIASAHGYSWQNARFWSENGQLIALGSQCMAIFG